jgi:hypothetical protein
MTSKEIAKLSKMQERIRVPAVVENPVAELETLLTKHAIVLVGGSARIISWRRRGLYPGDECRVLDLLSEAALKLFYRNKYTLEPSPDGGQKRVSLASKFFDLAERYGGLVYAPGEAEVLGGQYNMWRGFAIKAAPGNWPLMQAHIRDVIASGDDEVADYIIDWIAWAVQNPGQRAEVALVLRGGKGTGKGTLGNAMTKIFGSHGVHIASRKHLVGGFNMHMAHCSLLFADEAFWPGDKAGEGELKRMITEPELTIEPKGVDLFTVRNCLHVIIAGNENWIVPASGDERRFAVTEVSGARTGDFGYFRELHNELDGGGLEAMLHDLLERDLGGWHPRDNVPQTSGLRQQQAHSRKGVDALIEAVAHDGQLPCAKMTMPDVAITNGEAEREGFWHYAKTTVPDLRHRTSRSLMPELREWGCEPYKSGSVRGVRFPALDELRQRFDTKHGNQEWDDTEEWDEAEEWEP